MSCLCGDICCNSCGPAQGNWRCPVCRAWATDGCEHVNDDGTGMRPEFQAQADEQARQEAEAEAALTQQIEEADNLYWLQQELDPDHLP